MYVVCNEYTQHTHYFIESRKVVPKSSLFTFSSDAIVNPQWLELPMSRTNFHGPKDVRAVEVRLYVARVTMAETTDERAGFDIRCFKVFRGCSCQPDKTALLRICGLFPWYSPFSMLINPK